MKDILTYAFGVVVCSALFVLFYRTVLYRRTTFLAARIYLLASLVVAAVIPALDIPVWRVAPIEIAAVAMPFEISHTAPPVTVAVPVDWLKVSLWSLYGLGIVALGLAMIRQLVHIANIKLRAEIFRTEECRLAVSEEVSTPFSFLGTIFIGREISGTEMRQIVLHEASHVRHRHSQEKIAMETIKNIMWFNPFAWWTARLLSEVHEFEADRDVLDGGFTVEEYLTLIFRQIFGYIPELSVGLGDSLTKKRFFMMKQGMRLTRYSPLRVAGALPLAAGMMMLFSFTSRPPEIIFTDVPAPVETVVAAAAAAPKPDTVVRTEYLDVVPSRNVPVAAAQNPQEPQKSEDIPMHS